LKTKFEADSHTQPQALTNSKSDVRERSYAWPKSSHVLRDSGPSGMHTAEIAHMREARRDRGLCLAAWWQKVERDERNFFRKVENEEKSSMEEKIKSNKKKNDQEKFISKFFPACNSSPGGTLRQVKLEAKVALLVKSEDKIASIIMGQRKLIDCSLSL
jgi:hypothetical protein